MWPPLAGGFCIDPAPQKLISGYAIGSGQTVQLIIVKVNPQKHGAGHEPGPSGPVNQGAKEAD